MWSYRGLSVSMSENVKVITFFVMPWLIVKIAREEIYKLKK